MAFSGGRFRSPASAGPRARSTSSVFAVGRRAFIACAAEQLTGVILTDDSGATALGTLRDGVEVEIVAWRPLGSRGTRYLVRSSRDGIEGWLGVADLRRSNVTQVPDR
jgi:hypothetical protein